MTLADGKNTCERCEKKFVKKDELEYSQEYSAFFCSPDCATDFYFENAMSHPISYEEMLEKNKEVKQ